MKNKPLKVSFSSLWQIFIFLHILLVIYSQCRHYLVCSPVSGLWKLFSYYFFFQWTHWNSYLARRNSKSEIVVFRKPKDAVVTFDQYLSLCFYYSYYRSPCWMSVSELEMETQTRYLCCSSDYQPYVGSLPAARH